MCKDNSIIWFILLILIFFNCRGNSSSNPLNFNQFFELESSTPFYPGTGVF